MNPLFGHEQLTWMPNIKDVRCKPALLGCCRVTFHIDLYEGGVQMETYGQTYDHSHDNINFLDQWVTKLSKVWGSAVKSCIYIHSLPLISVALNLWISNFCCRGTACKSFLPRLFFLFQCFVEESNN